MSGSNSQQDPRPDYHAFILVNGRRFGRRGGSLAKIAHPLLTVPGTRVCLKEAPMKSFGGIDLPRMSSSAALPR
jgi:hypothetical protein